MAISFIIQKKIISIGAILVIKFAYLIFEERTISLLKIPIDSHIKGILYRNATPETGLKET